jgi:hypothetical protein
MWRIAHSGVVGYHYHLISKEASLKWVSASLAGKALFFTRGLGSNLVYTRGGF